MLSSIRRLGRPHQSPIETTDSPERGSDPNPTPLQSRVVKRMVPTKSPSPAEVLISHTATERTFTGSQDNESTISQESKSITQIDSGHATGSTSYLSSKHMRPHTLPYPRYGYPEHFEQVYSTDGDHVLGIHFIPPTTDTPATKPDLNPSPLLSTAANSMVPTKGPSPAEGLISHTATERTFLTCSEENTSTISQESNSMTHIDSGHATGSTSYLSYKHMRPPVLPLARYGYPEHFEQGCITGLHGEKAHGTASFYTSTPVSKEVAVNIAMYLFHKDCPNKESCPTCHLINRQFAHLLKQYKRAHTTLDSSKLHQHHYTRGTPKPLQPPQFGRQRSLSASMVNAEEQPTVSLDAIPREVIVSDSDLASSPSTHVPTSRRLPSRLKAHRAPTAIPLSQREEVSLPSSESLPTDERETFSRQGPDHNHEYSDVVARSLSPHMQQPYHSGASDFDAQSSSDADSVFFRPQTHHNIRPYLNIDEESKRRHHPRVKSDVVGHSTYRSPRAVTPKPSSVSPYHSPHQYSPHLGHSGSLTHPITLPKPGSQQTDV